MGGRAQKKPMKALLDLGLRGEGLPVQRRGCAELRVRDGGGVMAVPDHSGFFFALFARWVLARRPGGLAQVWNMQIFFTCAVQSAYTCGFQGWHRWHRLFSRLYVGAHARNFYGFSLCHLCHRLKASNGAGFRCTGRWGLACAYPVPRRPGSNRGGIKPPLLPRLQDVKDGDRDQECGRGRI